MLRGKERTIAGNRLGGDSAEAEGFFSKGKEALLEEARKQIGLLKDPSISLEGADRALSKAMALLGKAYDKGAQAIEISGPKTEAILAYGDALKRNLKKMANEDGLDLQTLATEGEKIDYRIRYMMERGSQKKVFAGETGYRPIEAVQEKICEIHLTWGECLARAYFNSTPDEPFFKSPVYGATVLAYSKAIARFDYMEKTQQNQDKKRIVEDYLAQITSPGWPQISQEAPKGAR